MGRKKMKILFIAQAFAPDSIIGAQRITKFAKYLSRMGHDITVLTSSQLWGVKDESSLSGLEKVRILRAGKEHLDNGIRSRRKIHIKINKQQVPRSVYLAIKKIYTEIAGSIHTLSETQESFQLLKKCYHKNLKYETFDFVFATYSTMADVFMGEYIKKRTGAGLILDLRDKMDNALMPTALRRRNHNIQGKMIRLSDKTFIVSADAMDELKRDYPDAAGKIFTLYNGYDDKLFSFQSPDVGEGILSFAYTGGLYSGKRDLRPLFKVFKALSENYGYKFKINYAGEDFEELSRQASQFQMDGVIQDYGAVSRKEAEQIQGRSDVFLVASWNSKNVRGALTGKFFEGIRADKPIVTIVTGGILNSELYRMNTDYHYGFCYEERREGSLKGLYQYIRHLYQQKNVGGCLQFSLNKEIKEKFHYKNLTMELERHLLETLRKKEETD